MKVLKSGKSKEFSLKHISHRADHFAVRYKSTLTLPGSGTYTFYTQSDDGSKIIIDGKVLVDHDGSHSSSSKSNHMELEEGLHSIEVLYFEDIAGEELEIYIEGPNIPKQILTDEFIK